ncbi:MAG: CopG family transcriptional regulator [Tepidisphaeraceae bacterium]
MMKQRKPLAPWLPGRFGRMTRAQLDAESDQYEAEFSGTRAGRVANSRPHPKKRGRPPKPAGAKAARVLITMAPRLLGATDAAADKRGLTRAALIRQAVLDWLARQPRPRKSA